MQPVSSSPAQPDSAPISPPTATLPTGSAASLQTYPVDVEHLGIRIVLPIAIIVSAIFLYQWLSTAWPDLLTSLGVADPAVGGTTALLVALIGALLIGAIVDRILKLTWPSGRLFQIDADHLTLIDRRAKTVTTLRRDLRLNVRTWRFQIQRSSPRAPRGWYMVACRFMQDETQMTLYTFMPSRKFELLPLVHTCEVLEKPPDRLTEMERRELQTQTLRARAEQRVLSELEISRMDGGAELNPADFTAVVLALAPHIHDWDE